jgi:hypothetical protein
MYNFVTFFYIGKYNTKLLLRKLYKMKQSLASLLNENVERKNDDENFENDIYERH